MKNLKSERQKIFLVGCARSGTTLLQSILASHHAISSFPETHFLRGTIPKFWLFQFIKYYGKKEQLFIKKYLKRIKRKELYNAIPNPTFNTLEWVDKIINLIDLIPNDLDSTIWIEKTPMHLYFIPLIQKVNPNIKYIHMIRDGKDVVASLFNASQNNPESFGGKQSIENCIKRWKHDIQIHKKYINHDNHFFITYEEIIKNSNIALKKLCKFLHIEFKEQMLSFSKMTRELKFSEENWKPDNSDELKVTKKFNSIFSEKQKKYILSQLNDTNINMFKQLG